MGKNAPSPPYTSVSDVDSFFRRVATIGEPRPPKKVDSAWVKNYSFETAHPSAIPSMLRWLGVISEEGESTGVWDKLRVDSTRTAVLQQLVQDAYSGVFDAVDVERATLPDLRGAFVSAYGIGDSQRHIKCFLALCKHAGIATAVEATARERETKPRENGATQSRQRKTATANGQSTAATTKTQAATNAKKRRPTPYSNGAIAITLNVEIPATWTDEEIRDRVAAVTRALEAGKGDS